MLGKTLSVMEAAMNASGLRHRVISSNIANSETPGFKGSRVEFEEELSKWMTEEDKTRLTTTDPRHRSRVSSQMPKLKVIKNTSDSMRLDGNNVDIDVESTKLAKNTLHYNALATQVYQYFSQLRTAMRDR
jgi:flagellar basal-body rod protein FlgB